MIGLFTYTLLYVLHKLAAGSLRKPSVNDVILITGCDSGIGYSLAMRCHKLGMTVVAACLDPGGIGPLRLKELGINVRVVELDVTSTASIRRSLDKMYEFFSKEPNLKLRALVNNAGVMIFGEFPWQTETQIHRQIAVNLTGAIDVTRIYSEEIIKQNARVINICSHCSLAALPGLSVYAASKTGLLAWSDALRIEFKKFNIPVISFIPGSFPTETNILAKQTEHGEEMRKSMSSFGVNLYKGYFQEYNTYLSYIAGAKEVKEIEDQHLYELFEHSLLSSKPEHLYSYSPWRYSVYHFLFKIAPHPIHDWLILKFVNMPKWKN